MRAEAALQRLWASAGGPATLLLGPLSLASALYGTGLAVRAAAYRAGLLKRRRLPVPVISVGNLAVGGTGKTPLVITLARALGARGRRVGILSRGYKGSHETRGPLLVSDTAGVRADPAAAGDEAVLLATRLPGVPVAVGARRADAGRLLLDAAPVDVLLLDDGFQHLALDRDADVVLVDAVAPLANGRLLPRGPLREPPRALGRADLVIARATEGVASPDLAAHTGARVLAARTRVTGVADARGEPAPALAGRRVLAVAGIARPERFRDTVAGLGAVPAGFLPFPDHAAYGPGEVARICTRARERDAELVATTAKDAVKLAPLWPVEAPPLRVVEIALEVEAPGGGDWVEELVARAEARFARRER